MSKKVDDISQFGEFLAAPASLSGDLPPASVASILLSILKVFKASTCLNGRYGGDLESFPYFADTVLQWLVLRLVFFSGQFYFFVVYCFSFSHYIQIVVVLLVHSAMILFLSCALSGS